MGRREWVWLAVLVLAVGVYNLPQLIAGTPQFDGVEVHYAAQRYLSDELHMGRLPFWTSYIFSGFPFLADLQVGAWYPLNWPFFAIGITPRSIGLELLVHTEVACIGTFLLARQLLPTHNPLAAAGAAMFYGLSGWFATHSQHVGMFDTAAWLPWLLLLLIELERNGVSLTRLALAGLLGAAIALPGSFQVALYTFAFVTVWAVGEAIASRKWHAYAIGLLTLGIWGALLAAVMILPTLELVAQSERALLNALSLPDIGYFHPASLLTLIYADYYGLLSGNYTGPGDSTQHYFYAGILLLPLACLGAVRNRRLLRGALLLGVPFLWYALGPSGFLYRVVARLPGFNRVELPMHGWFLPALGLALLAGAGLVVVEQRIGFKWTAAVLAFVFVDVLVVNQLLNPLAYARQSFDSLYGQALDTFDAQLTPSVQRVYGPPLTAVGYRNHGLQSRVETTYGYNPLELAAYAAYTTRAESDPGLVAGLAPSHSLVNGTLQPEPDALPLATFETDPTATVGVLIRAQDELLLHYATSSQQRLRVAIPNYPGWHATLADGRELPLTTVDGVFIDVDLAAGEGDLRLAYSPRWFGVGAAISLIALLAALLALYQNARGPESV